MGWLDGSFAVVVAVVVVVVVGGIKLHLRSRRPPF